MFSRNQDTAMSNGFLLSMLSPVWRARLCGGVGANEGQVLNMEGEKETLFTKVVALGCGRSVLMGSGLEELSELARMADRYQVEAVQGDVEQALMDQLSVESSGRILTIASGSGLVRLQTASREMALREFDQFVECAGFMDVSEEVLGSLLDDDGLVSESEERVLKGVISEPGCSKFRRI